MEHLNRATLFIACWVLLPACATPGPNQKPPPQEAKWQCVDEHTPPRGFDGEAYLQSVALVDLEEGMDAAILKAKKRLVAEHCGMNDCGPKLWKTGGRSDSHYCAMAYIKKSASFSSKRFQSDLDAVVATLLRDTPNAVVYIEGIRDPRPEWATWLKDELGEALMRREGVELLNTKVDNVVLIEGRVREQMDEDVMVAKVSFEANYRSRILGKASVALPVYALPRLAGETVSRTQVAAPASGSQPTEASDYSPLAYVGGAVAVSGALALVLGPILIAGANSTLSDSTTLRADKDEALSALDIGVAATVIGTAALPVGVVVGAFGLGDE